MGMKKPDFAAVLIGCSIALFANGEAQAQSRDVQGANNPPVIDKLFECRTITDPDRRLACFDREVGAVYDAQESRELVIAEREEIREARRGVFGLNVPKNRLLGNDKEDEDAEGEDDGINSITSTLTRANRLDNGRFVFELEDGARWLQTESTPGFKRYKAGDTIVIEKATLGSFKAKVNDGRAMKVRRIN